MKIHTKYGENVVKGFNIESCKIEVSKHFMLKYMKNWDWDFNDLREAIKTAHKITKVGKQKYEVYVRKKGSKKLIFVYYIDNDTIFVIGGSQGGKK